MLEFNDSKAGCLKEDTEMKASLAESSASYGFFQKAPSSRNRPTNPLAWTAAYLLQIL
jgi:hypothetical protein